MIKANIISRNGIIPKRHSYEAAGCDIHTNMSGTINPKEQMFITTGISLIVPHGYVAMTYGRSGLSNKYLLEVENTVIYPENKKELVLCIYNNGKVPFVFNEGERIAQVVFVETGCEIIEDK